MSRDGNIGLIIDQDGTHTRYYVKFRGDYRKPSCRTCLASLGTRFLAKQSMLTDWSKKGLYLIEGKLFKGAFHPLIQQLAVGPTPNKHKSFNARISSGKSASFARLSSCGCYNLSTYYPVRT
jgi:hypothetical protein